MIAAVRPRTCTPASFAEERSGWVRLSEPSALRADSDSPLFESLRRNGPLA
ncbi:MAG: hypothetical protein U5K43_10240 [Halofilum sp. (in: g-proteobacteria)]|nr:hypothetical protein [Halofilum sp. (in: g-proteobacteria)]